MNCRFFSSVVFVTFRMGKVSSAWELIENKFEFYHVAEPKTTEINKLNVVNEIFWLWQCSSQTIAEEAFERTRKFYWDRKLCYLYSDCFAKFSVISKLLNASWINKHVARNLGTKNIFRLYISRDTPKSQNDSNRIH